MREILITRDGGGPGKPKDRRLLGLLALAVLLFLIAVAIQPSREPFVRVLPSGPTTESPPGPPAPAPSPPPEEAPEPPAERDLTVSRFLTVLARGTPKATGERFVGAFARRPALRRALVAFKRTHGDDAPARELVAALLAQPEFRGLLGELRGDQDFMRTFSRLARDAEISSTLRGSMALARSARAAPEGRDERPESPDEPGDDDGATSPGSPAPGDAEDGGGAGASEHDAQPLGKIKAKVGERHARTFVLSALASMPKELLQELDEACERHDTCDPVEACGMTGLWDACVKACKVSGKCPRELMEGKEPGASTTPEK